MQEFIPHEITTRAVYIIIVVAIEYFAVLFSVLADLFSGIRKARRRGEATKSKALRRTIDKLARYYNVLIVLTVVDAMTIVGILYMRQVEGFDLPTIPIFTLIGAIGMAIIEVKSIFEKSDEKDKENLREVAEILENLYENEKLKNIIKSLKKHNP